MHWPTTGLRQHAYHLYSWKNQPMAEKVHDHLLMRDYIIVIRFKILNCSKNLAKCELS